MIHPIIHIATRAARAAASIILRSFDRVDRLHIQEKASRDFVTNVDKAAEQEIILLIKESHPTHRILAEEQGFIGSNTDSPLWIIDPLDGTLNFIHGVPHFCISIGIMIHGHIEHGVIYDPIRDELFSASRGRGAMLNQKRIRVSTRESLENSLLGTGFIPSAHDRVYNRMILDRMERVMPFVAGIRRAGSAALDLAYVASGRFDGFWETGLKPWDVAAGLILVREAGGLVSTLEGQEYDPLNSDSILAAPPKIHKALHSAFL